MKERDTLLDRREIPLSNGGPGSTAQERQSAQLSQAARGAGMAQSRGGTRSVNERGNKRSTIPISNGKELSNTFVKEPTNATTVDRG